MSVLGQEINHMSISKIPHVKDLGIKYKSGRFLTTPIENITSIRRIMDAEYSKLISRKNRKDKSKLLDQYFARTKDQKDKFLTVFGTHDFVFTGEYRHYAWYVQDSRACRAILFSGKRGTSVEIEVNEVNEPLGDAQFFYREFVEFINNL